MCEEDKRYPKEGKGESESLSHGTEFPTERQDQETGFKKYGNKMTTRIEKPEREEGNE